MTVENKDIEKIHQNIIDFKMRLKPFYLAEYIVCSTIQYFYWSISGICVVNIQELKEILLLEKKENILYYLEVEKEKLKGNIKKTTDFLELTFFDRVLQHVVEISECLKKETEKEMLEKSVEKIQEKFEERFFLDKENFLLKKTQLLEEIDLIKLKYIESTLQQNLKNFRNILEEFYFPSYISIYTLDIYYPQAWADFKASTKELKGILKNKNKEEMLKYIKEEYSKLDAEYNAIGVGSKLLEMPILAIVLWHFMEIIEFLEDKPGKTVEEVEERFFEVFSERTGEYMSFKARVYADPEYGYCDSDSD
jgi:hypothetical protein